MRLELEYILHLTQKDVTHIMLEAEELDPNVEEAPVLAEMIGRLAVS